MFITELSSGQTSPGIRRVKESSVSRSLPRHFKLAAHTPASALSYYDIAKDKLYVAKSITLVCQVAYAHVAQIFLTNLYKYEYIFLFCTIVASTNIFYGMAICFIFFIISDVFHGSRDQVSVWRATCTTFYMKCRYHNQTVPFAFTCRRKSPIYRPYPLFFSDPV